MIFSWFRTDFQHIFRVNFFNTKKSFIQKKNNFIILLPRSLAIFSKKIFIYDKLNNYPNQLSGGEKQRVSLVRSIITKPSIVLADEPTGNLDKENSNTIYSLFKKLNKELNQTFAIVTHDNEIPKFCDSVYEIKNKELKKIK